MKTTVVDEMLIIKPANAKYSKLLSLIYQINLLQKK